MKALLMTDQCSEILQLSGLTVEIYTYTLFLIRYQEERSRSPEPSVVSMKSDQSIEFPITFREAR